MEEPYPAFNVKKNVKKNSDPTFARDANNSPEFFKSSSSLDHYWSGHAAGAGNTWRYYPPHRVRSFNNGMGCGNRIPSTADSAAVDD